MRRTTRLLGVYVESIAVLGMLLLAVLSLAGCVAPDAVVPVPATATPAASLPTETPHPTSTPVPTAMDFPLAAPTQVAVSQQDFGTCVQCHTDEAIETGWPEVFLGDLGFLETIHGRYGCITCHGGTGNTMLREVAHTGLISEPGAADLCADCHVEEVSTAGNNLHASLTGYRTVLFARSSSDDTNALESAIENHCDSCHAATCGQCHVSRPAELGGGMVAGHEFRDIEAINITCAGCHGSRVEAEYKNADGNGQGDVHWEQAKMLCTDCHVAPDFHGTEDEHLKRYDGPPNPSCDALGCHPDVAADDGIEQHAGSHLKSLSCQVCHATAYRNCYGCHLELSGDTPSFTLEATQLAFKIARNPLQGRYRPWRFVPVRHVPITEDSFSAYGEDLLDDFDVLPTWKYATPHTIQRITPQNQSCNACHGNAELYLTEDDVAPEELRANWTIIVDRVTGPVD